MSKEKREKLTEEQKIIDKDAYDLIHSKGLFGIGTSQAEEDANLDDVLPQFEDYGQTAEIRLDIDFGQSRLPLQEKAGLLGYFMQE